jgi:hypothetical protein
MHIASVRLALSRATLRLTAPSMPDTADSLAGFQLIRDPQPNSDSDVK